MAVGSGPEALPGTSTPSTKQSGGTHACGADGTGLSVAIPMPELRGTAFDGQPVRIIRDGKPKVVVFLAHWCPHCQREVPRLAAWLRGGRGPLGVDVYAVASATKREAPNYPPSAWLKREGW